MEGQSVAPVLTNAKLLYTQLTMFVPSMVLRVTQHSLERFLSGSAPALPRVLLFSEKKETSLLYKKLSADLDRLAVVGEAPSSDSVLVDKFGVTRFPSIFVCVGGAIARPPTLPPSPPPHPRPHDFF
jgi:hypothetical protein